MKKQCLTRLLSLTLALLMCFGCAGAVRAEDAGEHRVTQRDYTVYIGTTAEETLNKPFALCFLDGVDDLPYMEIGLWASLLYYVYTKEMNDPGYDLAIEYDGDTVTLTRENGYTMELDFENDLLVFLDYNAFMKTSGEGTLIDLVSERGMDDRGNAELIMRNNAASFERNGDLFVVDLDDYGIHMVHQGDLYCVPLQTLCDFTLLYSRRSLIFNGEALFLTSDKQLFDYSVGDYTEVASIYYSAPTGDRSAALAEYSYSELCLALDCFYGLKEIHDIYSFRQLFWEIGHDEALSGESALDADIALKSVIDYYLDDIHSTFCEFSALAGLNPIQSGKGMGKRSLDSQIELYKAARGRAYPDGWLRYEEVGNTAYITFDEFSSYYYGRQFYEAKEDGQMLDDTIGQIIAAHQQITREDSPIENVVLDLSNNTGGAVDAAVFVLGWFLGDASVSVKDMATGAMANAVYRADVNLDHVYDEKDTVADRKLYCLISPVSFSCGNLVPAALKASQRVTLIGRTSGGGSCVVQPMSTAYGTVFEVSACHRLSFLKNGAFYDIDQGVEPDYYIDNISNLYNREALTAFINGLF